MPLLILPVLLHALLVLFASSSVANAQTVENVYIYVNDTSRWATHGIWQTLDSFAGFGGHWLQPIPSANVTSATCFFQGTGFILFGSVVNGTDFQQMNVSVKVDDANPVTPIYTPGTNRVNGTEITSQIYSDSSLSYKLHTLTLTVNGTTPFLLQGIVYNPSNSSSQMATTTVITGGPSQGASSPSATASTSSNDSVKLGGAIGGGLGALLLVVLIIIYMMRRLRRAEKKESALQPQPFVAKTPVTRSRANTATSTPTTTTTMAAAGRAPKPGKPSVTSTSTTTTDRGRPLNEKTRLAHGSTATSSSTRSIHKPPLPTSTPPSRSHSRSHSQSRSQSNPYSHPYRPPSPVGSFISVPSDYQDGAFVPAPGTAVASSYIGESPLPAADLPPVPPLPRDVKRRPSYSEKQYSRKEKQRSSNNPMPPTPSSGLGLFSSESVNTVVSGGSALSRPLPVVPGTRSSASSHNFPPEKVGLSPPPRRTPNGYAGKKSTFDGP